MAQHVHPRAPVGGGKTHDADREFTAPEWIVERRDGILQRTFGQLVVGNDQHPVGEAAGNLVVAGKRAGQSRSAAAGDADQRLQRSTNRIHDPLLRLIDGGEKYGAGGHHHRIDVLDGELCVRQGTVDRFAHQAGLADVGTPA